MNIVSDPNSIPPGKLLSPEANQAAVPAGATGVLTVDLDAIVANWRKLEKTARAGRMRRGDQGERLWLRRRTGGTRPRGRRLQDVFCRHARRSARRARRVAVGGDLRARRLFPELRRRLRQERRQARDRRSQRTRRVGRVLPPLRLGRRCRHSHRHRHEPARPDASPRRRASFPGSMPAITASRWS